MWPWEHAALGYLLLSILARLLWNRSPSDAETLAVLVGTQFPDLLDKPLGWVLEVFPSGVSVGHSVFVAPVVCVSLLSLGVLIDRHREALAFSLGYLSHLPADVGYGALTGGQVNPSVVLWPVAVIDVRGETPVLLFVRSLFDNYVELIASGLSNQFLVFEVVFLAVAATLWVLDGRPGLPPYRKRIARRPDPPL